MKALLTLIHALAVAAPACHAGALTVNVSGVTKAGGRIMVAVCDKAHFLRHGCAYLVDAPARIGVMSLVIDEVPEGRFAIQVIQDLNGNGDLDMNLLRLPTEPYGFSGRRQLVPTFDRSAFEMGRGPMTVTVRLH